ncbi:MAG TPA: type I 3-dehydroquinate dehydratase, partial [Deltaproteobacteria bacterium]|nr:type I 3-dehydroquinate dehydratase [Deltaproteobacteria bacterium]
MFERTEGKNNIAQDLRFISESARQIMICVPITSSTNKEALRAVQRGCLAADCVELRMDLIASGNLRQLISAARRVSPAVKTIVTCRKKEEALKAGEKGKTASAKTKSQKLSILKEAISLGADFIDIELAEGKKVIGQLKSLCARQGN